MSDIKKKILYIDFDIPNLLKDNEFPAGGVANEWLSWMEGIKQTDNKIGVLTWEGAKKFINKELDFDIIESYNPKTGIPILRFFYYIFPKFIKAIQKYNPDILVQETPSNLTLMSAIASKILGKTFIFRIGSDRDVDDRLKKVFGKRAMIAYMFALRNTDILLCQNEYQYKTLKEKFPQKKIFIIVPPYSMKKDLSSVNENHRKYIAWMGNFRYEKNIAALVPIAKKLPNIKFKITGKSISSNIDRISLNALEELKTLANVEFTGYIKRAEILPFLSRAIALLNTSHLEGFPMTFLEAWATGTPVITTKNANPNNLIIKHSLGMVAETYDELTNTIKNIIDSEPNHDLRNRCRDYVKKHHDPQILATKLIEVYNEVKN
jgi:glycosyltransferase involved in cell wall biosynthesis